MDRTGLLRDVFLSAENINKGKTWQNTAGLESNGRVTYQHGLDVAMNSFQSAQTHAVSDLELTILAEQTFIMQELQFCDSSNTQVKSSLERAIKSFDDALCVLTVVSDPLLYEAVEKSYPNQKEYRYKSTPKDAFHSACISHKARINNILKSPGINLIERQLLSQRSSNMATAQSIYLNMQKKSLGL